MKKQTIYYIVGAVLVGAGAYLYVTKNNKKNDSDKLTPPKEVDENKAPDLSTPPLVGAYDSIKKLLESFKIGSSKQTQTPNTNA